MFKLSTVLLVAGSLAFSLQAAPILNINIGYQVTPIGTLERYNYVLSLASGSIPANTEIDIQFNPTTTGVLSNGVAPQDYNLQLFQPNQPPQASGDYSLLSLVNNPTLTGRFSVDFTYTGVGIPGPQQFFVYDDSVTNFGTLIQSGFTIPLSTGGVPEPSSGWLGVIGLTITGIFVTANRKISRAANS